LKALALLGAAPVVTLEEMGEPHFAPRVELAWLVLHVHVIDEADVAHALHALGSRDERRDALRLLQHLIAHASRDKNVAVGRCVTKDVQMSGVEKIERTRGIADSNCHLPPRND